MAVIPSLPQMWCEPFADSSQIPTYLVSRLASGHVKVSLSGDGGDELFYGYNRYFLAEQIWGKAARVPQWCRRAAAATLNSIPRSWYQSITAFLPPGSRIANLADRAPKLSSILSQSDQRLFYRELISHWKNPEQLVLQAKEPETFFTATGSMAGVALPELMMLTDMSTYLPDDILVKVDRASMANSLEARVPLLDHRLVELAWQIPLRLKRSSTGGKQILKDLVHQYVPEKLMDRPKMGFGVPIDDWLRGPMRDWAESLLNAERLRSEGYLNAGLVSGKWHEHVNGERRWHYYLWDVLMFQAWLEKESQPLERPVS
jgi:asparagine synthase (glutamine-hydrolysing)